MNQTLLNKINKIKDGVISNKYKVKQIWVIKESRKDWMYCTEYHKYYEVFLSNGLNIEVNFYERELFGELELVGDFHWVRRWKNEYQCKKQTLYSLSLYEKSKFLERTDLKEELQYRKELQDLFKWCENKIKLQQDAYAQKEQREKELKQKKEQERISKFLKSI